MTRYACANAFCPRRAPVAADVPPTCYTCGQAMSAELVTAPVLSPARWWRDDATRYVTRGPQIVLAPKTEPVSTDWAWEPISRPPDPVGDIRAFLDDLRREIDRINWITVCT